MVAEVFRRTGIDQLLGFDIAKLMFIRLLSSFCVSFVALIYNYNTSIIFKLKIEIWKPMMNLHQWVFHCLIVEDQWPLQNPNRASIDMCVQKNTDYRV